MYNVSLETLLGRAIGLLIGFTLHEFAHAWTADRLGDRTPYYQGRVTLDPRAHIDPIGIALALLAGFGWAKPVPINPSAFYPNEKRGLVIVSLAGPVMNLLIGIVVGLILRATLANASLGSFTYSVLYTVMMFNFVLFLFNLLPLSPLDGYKIAVGVLPWRYSSDLTRYERETTFILLLLLMMGVITRGRLDILWTVLGPPLTALRNLILGW
ncbi:MAG TPA: site-2 protease family protein [Aggregatilinea sp.]|uniref:site-2 protease family protein n=1 Tax=Aggregatilinea sp. TaxID=2806333 RepID=UPI002B6CD54E|nr:site-2 protease family protein [Aggregatilinea sp.]HML24933.1 site-2 protease family protein [Aggregatilinea sp.]